MPEPTTPAQTPANGTDLIRIEIPARAGILGNPSDGFFGKTIAIPVRNFHAQITLFQWDRIEILPGPTDHVNFRNLMELIEDLKINGYYGGFRLIKAAIKQFHEYILAQNIQLPEKQFTIRYTSTIPRQVGLAGSSAIITATIRALCQFYGVSIEPQHLANYVMWAETKELGISAGLQDRVVQAYNAPVFMNFDQAIMERQGFGEYSTIPAEWFPPLYLAYRVNLTHEPTAHNDIRNRWKRGEQQIIDVMAALAQNTVDGYEALKRKDWETFNRTINHNFDLRASIYPIPEKNQQMIQLARSVGATAKFPGSGGAIVGTYADETQFKALVEKFKAIGCGVVKITL